MAVLSFLTSLTLLVYSVSSHTTKICASVEGTSVTLWAGTYHSANENSGSITGGIIISGGPCCNARYNFQHRQAGSTNPPGVDLSKFSCSQCPNWSGSFASWQSVTINGLQSGTWHVTSTSDHVIETPWPNCNFPDIVLTDDFFNCAGCSAGANTCHEFDNVGDGLDVFACQCTFSGGVNNAQGCCENGFHVCNSADEMATFGLTTAICESTIPTDEAYWSLESGPGNFICESDSGQTGTNDVWGCTGSVTEGAFGPNCFLNHDCGGSTNIVCQSGSHGSNPWDFPNSNGFDELNVMEVTDGTKSGVMCCEDPVPVVTPTPPPSTPNPTPFPTPSPTAYPTPFPTPQPTPAPTDEPTPAPTNEPTPAPTNNPTRSPSRSPSQPPTNAPTAQPTWYPPCSTNPCDCNSNEDPHCEICHANGCDECELGPNDETGYYWKLDYNYPCVGCQAIFGNECLHCQDFNGCGQCDEGYIRTHDTQEDLYYCVPAPPTPAPVNPTPNPTQSNVCSYQPQTCASNNCAGDGENPHCSQQNTWGCSSCNNGYFMVNHQTACVPCSALDGCATCADWNGCTSCNAGYTWEWNNACNLGMCA